MDIDKDVVARPVEIAPVAEAQAEIGSGPVMDSKPEIHPGRPPEIGRIGRIPPRPVDVEGIIVGDIDGGGVGRFDNNGSVVHDDRLL